MSGRMGVVFESPWSKRLQRDYREMNKLRDNSSILDFETTGDPPDTYNITFKGTTLQKKPDGTVVPEETEQKVQIQLGLDYPRAMPRVKWLTKIHHPNIWGHGTVCVRDVWTPNVRLIDLVQLLWDMARLIILNPKSAYEGGRDASAEWNKLKDKYGPWPIDTRPLENLAPRREEEEGEAEIFIMGDPNLGALGTRVRPWVRCGNTPFWRWKERPLLDQLSETLLDPVSFTMINVITNFSEEETDPLPLEAIVQRITLAEEPPPGFSEVSMFEALGQAIENLPDLHQTGVQYWFEVMTDMDKDGLSDRQQTQQFSTFPPQRQNLILSGLEKLLESDAIPVDIRSLLVVNDAEEWADRIPQLERDFKPTEPTIVAPLLEERKGIADALSYFGIHEC